MVAQFVKSQYSVGIFAVPEWGGKATVSEVSPKYNELIEIGAVPSPGFEFKEWLVEGNCEIVNDSLARVLDDCNLSAVFVSGNPLEECPISCEADGECNYSCASDPACSFDSDCGGCNLNCAENGYCETGCEESSLCSPDPDCEECGNSFYSTSFDVSAKNAFTISGQNRWNDLSVTLKSGGEKVAECSFDLYVNAEQGEENPNIVLVDGKAVIGEEDNVFAVVDITIRTEDYEGLVDIELRDNKNQKGKTKKKDNKLLDSKTIYFDNEERTIGFQIPVSNGETKIDVVAIVDPLNKIEEEDEEDNEKRVKAHLMQANDLMVERLLPEKKCYYPSERTVVTAWILNEGGKSKEFDTLLSRISPDPPEELAEIRTSTG